MTGLVITGGGSPGTGHGCRDGMFRTLVFPLLTEVWSLRTGRVKYDVSLTGDEIVLVPSLINKSEDKVMIPPVVVSSPVSLGSRGE